MKNTNIYGATIVENRYIGKVQLNADDLGGTGCSTWAQYRQLCDNVVRAAYNRIVGRGVDENILGLSVSALFEFFGVDAKATHEYQARLLATTIARKAQRSQTLKDAIKAKNGAKKALETAIDEEKTEEEIAALQEVYDGIVAEVEGLYAEPHNFWYDLVPMLDKTRKHATAQARKAIEDTIADIINERELMTVEELEAEAKRLADERKGRAIRKKAEAKAKAEAEAEAETK